MNKRDWLSSSSPQWSCRRHGCCRAGRDEPSTPVRLLLHPQGHPQPVRSDRRRKRELALTALGCTQVVSRLGLKTRPAAHSPAIQAAIQSHRPRCHRAIDPQAVCPASFKQASSGRVTKIVALRLGVTSASSSSPGGHRADRAEPDPLLGKLILTGAVLRFCPRPRRPRNQNAWIKYMKLELKKPAYNNMKLVNIYYGNDNPAQSRRRR